LKTATPIPAQTPTATPETNKIVLKFKKTATGKELLQNMQNSQITAQIKVDYNINKYRRLKRGCKPAKGCTRYTLSNIKYIIDHHTYDQNNGSLVASMRYYFGDSINKIKEINT
jgi:hypothetical protein